MLEALKLADRSPARVQLDPAARLDPPVGVASEHPIPAAVSLAIGHRQIHGGPDALDVLRKDGRNGVLDGRAILQLPQGDSGTDRAYVLRHWRCVWDEQRIVALG